MGAAVLVVDDSMVVRKQVGRSLTDAGYTVVEAADGVEALQKLGEANEVGLVVCDVNMPNMDGLQFLEQLQKSPSAGLPVVMLTTEGQPGLIQRARELGAKGWIIKPFKPDLFLGVAKKILGGS
jgi:two-component system, chemotaxis family, chemotaxis protein CheY